MLDHRLYKCTMTQLLLVLSLASVTTANGFKFAADSDNVLGENHNENFTCDGKDYGYYADQTLDCKVFHICSPVTSSTGRHVKTLMFSFFCPSKTRFSQDSKTCKAEKLAMPCDKAHTLYDLNKAIGQSTPRDIRKHTQTSRGNVLSTNVIPGGSGIAKTKPIVQSDHRFSVGLSSASSTPAPTQQTLKNLKKQNDLLTSTEVDLNNEAKSFKDSSNANSNSLKNINQNNVQVRHNSQVIKSHKNTQSNRNNQSQQNRWKGVAQNEQFDTRTQSKTENSTSNNKKSVNSKHVIVNSHSQIPHIQSQQAKDDSRQVNKNFKLTNNQFQQKSSFPSKSTPLQTIPHASDGKVQKNFNIRTRVGNQNTPIGLPVIRNRNSNNQGQQLIDKKISQNSMANRFSSVHFTTQKTSTLPSAPKFKSTNERRFTITSTTPESEEDFENPEIDEELQELIEDINEFSDDFKIPSLTDQRQLGIPFKPIKLNHQHTTEPRKVLLNTQKVNSHMKDKTDLNEPAEKLMPPPIFIQSFLPSENVPQNSGDSAQRDSSRHINIKKQESHNLKTNGFKILEKNIPTKDSQTQPSKLNFNTELNNKKTVTSPAITATQTVKVHSTNRIASPLSSLHDKNFATTFRPNLNKIGIASSTFHKQTPTTSRPITPLTNAKNRQQSVARNPQPFAEHHVTRARIDTTSKPVNVQNLTKIPPVKHASRSRGSKRFNHASLHGNRITSRGRTNTNVQENTNERDPTNPSRSSQAKNIQENVNNVSPVKVKSNVQTTSLKDNKSHRRVTKIRQKTINKLNDESFSEIKIINGKVQPLSKLLSPPRQFTIKGNNLKSTEPVSTLTTSKLIKETENPDLELQTIEKHEFEKKEMKTIDGKTTSARVRVVTTPIRKISTTETPVTTTDHLSKSPLVSIPAQQVNNNKNRGNQRFSIQNARRNQQSVPETIHIASKEIPKTNIRAGGNVRRSRKRLSSTRKVISSNDVTPLQKTKLPIAQSKVRDSKSLENTHRNRKTDQPISDSLIKNREPKIVSTHNNVDQLLRSLMGTRQTKSSIEKAIKQIASVKGAQLIFRTVKKAGDSQINKNEQQYTNNRNEVRNTQNTNIKAPISIEKTKKVVVEAPRNTNVGSHKITSNHQNNDKLLTNLKKSAKSTSSIDEAIMKIATAKGAQLIQHVVKKVEVPKPINDNQSVRVPTNSHSDIASRRVTNPSRTNRHQGRTQVRQTEIKVQSLQQPSVKPKIDQQSNHFKISESPKSIVTTPIRKISTTKSPVTTTDHILTESPLVSIPARQANNNKNRGNQRFSSQNARRNQQSVPKTIHIESKQIPKTNTRTGGNVRRSRKRLSSTRKVISSNNVTPLQKTELPIAQSKVSNSKFLENTHRNRKTDQPISDSLNRNREPKIVSTHNNVDHLLRSLMGTKQTKSSIEKAIKQIASVKGAQLIFRTVKKAGDSQINNNEQQHTNNSNEVRQTEIKDQSLQQPSVTPKIDQQSNHFKTSESPKSIIISKTTPTSLRRQRVRQRVRQRTQVRVTELSNTTPETPSRVEVTSTASSVNITLQDIAAVKGAQLIHHDVMKEKPPTSNKTTTPIENIIKEPLQLDKAIASSSTLNATPTSRGRKRFRGRTEVKNNLSSRKTSHIKNPDQHLKNVQDSKPLKSSNRSASKGVRRVVKKIGEVHSETLASAKLIPVTTLKSIPIPRGNNRFRSRTQVRRTKVNNTQLRTSNTESLTKQTHQVVSPNDQEINSIKPTNTNGDNLKDIAPSKGTHIIRKVIKKVGEEHQTRNEFVSLKSNSQENKISTSTPVTAPTSSQSNKFRGRTQVRKTLIKETPSTVSTPSNNIKNSKNSNYLPNTSQLTSQQQLLASLKSSSFSSESINSAIQRIAGVKGAQLIRHVVTKPKDSKSLKAFSSQGNKNSDSTPSTEFQGRNRSRGRTQVRRTKLEDPSIVLAKTTIPEKSSSIQDTNKVLTTLNDSSSSSSSIDEDTKVLPSRNQRHHIRRVIKRVGDIKSDENKPKTPTTLSSPPEKKIATGRASSLQRRRNNSRGRTQVVRKVIKPVLTTPSSESEAIHSEISDVENNVKDINKKQLNNNYRSVLIAGVQEVLKKEEINSKPLRQKTRTRTVVRKLSAVTEKIQTSTVEPTLEQPTTINAGNIVKDETENKLKQITKDQRSQNRIETIRRGRKRYNSARTSINSQPDTIVRTSTTAIPNVLTDNTITTSSDVINNTPLPSKRLESLRKRQRRPAVITGRKVGSSEGIQIFDAEQEKKLGLAADKNLSTVNRDPITSILPEKSNSRQKVGRNRGSSIKKTKTNTNASIISFFDEFIPLNKNEKKNDQNSSKQVKINKLSVDAHKSDIKLYEREELSLAPTTTPIPIIELPKSRENQNVKEINRNRRILKVNPLSQLKKLNPGGTHALNEDNLSGLKLRVVGTSVKSSVSFSKGTDETKLTDQELKAHRELTNLPPTISKPTSRRRLISRRKL